MSDQDPETAGVAQPDADLAALLAELSTPPEELAALLAELLDSSDSLGELVADLAQLLAELTVTADADLDELLATTCPACGHRWRP